MKTPKCGVGTSENKAASPDPIGAMILRESLRIADVHTYMELDLLAIVLNCGDVLQARISNFDRLKKVTGPQLKKWRLIGGDSGIKWKQLMRTSPCAALPEKAVSRKLSGVWPGQEVGPRQKAEALTLALSEGKAFSFAVQGLQTITRMNIE